MISETNGVMNQLYDNRVKDDEMIQVINNDKDENEPPMHINPNYVKVNFRPKPQL